MPDLQAIIERLGAATEGSRELDAMLAVALDIRPNWLASCEGYMYARTDKGASHDVLWVDAGSSKSTGNPSAWYETDGYGADRRLPYFTASVDAALALMERVLPGWSLRLFVHPDAAYADVYQLGELTHFPEGKVERRITSDYHEGNFIQHRLPALAIVLATLKALRAKGDRHAKA